MSLLTEDENGSGVEEKAETDGGAEEEGHLERRRNHDGEWNEGRQAGSQACNAVFASDQNLPLNDTF